MKLSFPILSVTIAFSFFSNVAASADGQISASTSTAISPATPVAVNGEAALRDFKSAYEFYSTKEYQKAFDKFQSLVNPKFTLNDYVVFFMAMSARQLGKTEEAEKLFKQVDSLGANFKLKTDAMIERAHLALEKGQYKDAKNLLAQLEKRNRSSEAYPEIIFDLARAEKSLKNKTMMCKWLHHLYVKNPAFEKIQDWGPVLGENKFQNEESKCPNDLADMRTRVKNLLWNGFDKKALEEIQFMRKRSPDEEQKFKLDGIESSFHFQEGNVAKAMDLLKPYFETHKNDFNFLMQFGNAAARSGDLAGAVGAYYKAYKLSPKSQKGKQALFQSAFMSYQFEDYDGAERKFKEFKKTFAGSGLQRDASWHLAWITYLKGDFESAYKGFLSLKNEAKRNRKARKAFSLDRLNYWMAMSLLRMNKVEQARDLFSELASDKLEGFYAIAAAARLKNFPTVAAPSGPTPLRRFSRSEFLTASMDADYLMETVAEESEDNLSVAEDGTDESREDLAQDDAASDSKSASIGDLPAAEEAITSFRDPKHVARFEKARDLMIVGLNELAKWDLWEIEKTTRNKEYLRMLMAEYLKVGHYHRVSSIAQLFFNGSRAAYGLDGIRYMWEYAYPQAYDKQVQEYSSRFTVPKELIWGIMRAESVYRKDAISPVGALGLMQVMPYTASRVAGLIGEKNFQVKTLLEPEPAIRIGSRYLRRLMDRYGGSIPLVAASYNAGPHRVDSWLKNFGHLESDEFVEHIPFVETRNYVKKVISNAQVYADLYGDKKPVVPHLSTKLPALKLDDRNPAKENWDDI